MRQNYNTTVDGERVKLVPYRPEHVDVYHRWMADPWLQQATASEPLSLEEERRMQESWAEDPKKCTFILLDKTRGGAMAGDVNLFWNDEDPSCAEIEVMVAEEGSRRRGLACEALQLFMAYATRVLGVQRFVAKIGEDNVASIALFIKLGFSQNGRSPIFKEVHMELAIAGSVEAQMKEVGQRLVLGTYEGGPQEHELTS
ncbi:unnamed protein product [Ostreobium quekettii]|uniref:N-acetyltransferase domain-containing protein n=1 Tax=Ostreobium quekettii TaxID=121088 RepID=A0A8S1JFW4_9CHLO|nr:unnamed protein product [Ostreobium quekettii]